MQKTDGNEDHTFGWTLDSDSWTVWSGSDSNAIIRATKDGLEVKGVIKADTGYIGGNNGFTISAQSIYKGIPSMDSANTSGVYIGTDGIRLGDGFSVTSGGYLRANSGSFGSLNINSSGSTVGTYSGSLSGCGGSVSGLGGSLSTGIAVGGKNISTYVGDIVAGKITASSINSVFENSNTLKARQITFNGHPLSCGYVTDGNGVSIQVVRWY